MILRFCDFEKIDFKKNDPFLSQPLSEVTKFS